MQENLYDPDNDPNGAQGIARANALYGKRRQYQSPYFDEKPVPSKEKSIEKKLEVSQDPEEIALLESLLSLIRTIKE
jgi:hypothetical protein